MIKNLPNFLIIGAGKSGTSSLSYQLGQHPNIFICEIKETHFFNINWKKGMSWYYSQFKDGSHCKAIGEASVTYSIYPIYNNIPQRIDRILCSKLKLIYMVRHPVDRMISHYMHDIIKGYIPVNMSFEEAIIADDKYRLASSYYTQISQYLKYYPIEQIKIIIFEKYIKNPNKELEEIFDFLDVSDDSIVIDTQARNVTANKQWIPIWLRNIIKLKQVPIIGSLIQPLLSIKEGKKYIYKAFGTSIQKPELHPNRYNELLNDFHFEIENLTKLVNKDFLNIWHLR